MSYEKIFKLVIKSTKDLSEEEIKNLYEELLYFEIEWNSRTKTRIHILDN